MAATLTLTLKNDLSEIVRGAQAIEARGEARGWPPRWTTGVNLALDELLSNVINHGYRDSDEHEVLVTLSERDGALEVLLVDDGVAFDPSTDAPEPDLESSLEARETKGLGVHFVKSFVDEVAYTRRDGRNHTTLLLRPPETSAPTAPSQGLAPSSLSPTPASPPSSPTSAAASASSAAPFSPDSQEIRALFGMAERDLRVAALDPLGLDAFVTEGGLTAPNVNAIERTCHAAAARALQRRWHREDALAALRDLGFLAAVLERHRVRASTSGIMAQALVKLHEAALEVPRDTFYSYGPRNPSGPRMRTFTTLPEERIFILSIANAARCVPLCIGHLTLGLSSAFSATGTSAVAECLTQASMALESLVSALIRVKRTMPPEVFSAEIAPCFPDLEIAGKRYDGPSAAHLGVQVIDRLVFPAELTGRKDYETYFALTTQPLPQELRHIVERLRDYPSLLELARDGQIGGHATLASLRELLQQIYRFRVPHLRLAEASFASRPAGATGSGGYDTEMLQTLANFTRSSLDELDVLVKRSLPDG